MRKPSNTLLEAMDQMEQIPGIAGVWSEVRCQTRHTKPMRNFLIHSVSVVPFRSFPFRRLCRFVLAIRQGI